jgi:hypothetical protein
VDQRIDQRLIGDPFLERAGRQAGEIPFGDAQRDFAALVDKLSGRREGARLKPSP